MTPDQALARESIRATIAAYTYAGDRLLIDDFVNCFTEDAVIETDRVAPPDDFRYAGHAAIRDWQERWRAGGSGVHAATFIRHHLSTCHITLTGADSATAVTYWSAWTDIGPDHAGTYRDDFVRDGSQWLIAHRHIRRDWQAAGSLFLGAVDNSRG